MFGITSSAIAICILGAIRNFLQAHWRLVEVKCLSQTFCYCSLRRSCVVISKLLILLIEEEGLSFISSRKKENFSLRVICWILELYNGKLRNCWEVWGRGCLGCFTAFNWVKNSTLFMTLSWEIFCSSVATLWGVLIFCGSVLVSSEIGYLQYILVWTYLLLT